MNSAPARDSRRLASTAAAPRFSSAFGERTQGPSTAARSNDCPRLRVRSSWDVPRSPPKFSTAASSVGLGARASSRARAASARSNHALS
jgi:hypothetical protein